MEVHPPYLHPPSVEEKSAVGIERHIAQTYLDHAAIVPGLHLQGIQIRIIHVPSACTRNSEYDFRLHALPPGKGLEPALCRSCAHAGTVFQDKAGGDGP